ncbi:hypothetical protein O3P69_011062 [Scylla paramamosain]|uniref:Uncharacterized protein n=1 Tax=Scylla paramamosain TaxID=85552 RepID=A0AAW0STS1_SCYPA
MTHAQQTLTHTDSTFTYKHQRLRRLHHSRLNSHTVRAAQSPLHLPRSLQNHQTLFPANSPPRYTPPYSATRCETDTQREREKDDDKNYSDKGN